MAMPPFFFNNVEVENGLQSLSLAVVEGEEGQTLISFPAYRVGERLPRCEDALSMQTC
jgi:hypothetical protein